VEKRLITFAIDIIFLKDRKNAPFNRIEHFFFNLIEVEFFFGIRKRIGKILLLSKNSVFFNLLFLRYLSI
jgi:hypothetical protein